MNQTETTRLEGLDKLDAYRIVEQKTIHEMQSEGLVLEHKKDGSQTVFNIK